MKQATREWVKKVEEDYLSALDLARRRKVPLHNSVCFHCEQCAEKYLRGCTESHRIGACRASVSDAVGCVLSEDGHRGFTETPYNLPALRVSVHPLRRAWKKRVCTFPRPTTWKPC